MVDLYLNTIHILKLRGLRGRVYEIEMKINSEAITMQCTVTTNNKINADY